MRVHTLGLLLGSAGSALGELQVDFASQTSIKAAARDVAFDVMSYYKGNQSGEILGILEPWMGNGTGYRWWNSAILWSTMIDYWRYTGDDTYNSVTAEALTAQNGHDEFGLGGFFLPMNWSAGAATEDHAFWAIAAMQATELGFPTAPQGQRSWLELAQGVFDIQADRWAHDEGTCNGGLRWLMLAGSKSYDLKGAVSAGAFLNLGARLSRYTGNQTYADWAEKSWTWLTTTGLIDDEFNVWDGAWVDSNCTRFNIPRWSYAAGVLVEAAAYMYNHTTAQTQQTWQTRLVSLTNATLTLFFPDQTALVELDCETKWSALAPCKQDNQIFKGILLRSLASAAQLAPGLLREPLLEGGMRATAKRAVELCDGGLRDRECGFEWVEVDSMEGAAEGKVTGLRVEMDVLAALLGVVEGGVRGVRTAATANGSGGGGGAGEGGQGGGSGRGSEEGEGKSAGAGLRVGLGVLLAGLVAALWC